jgi:hypothetical protein
MVMEKLSIVVVADNVTVRDAIFKSPPEVAQLPSILTPDVPPPVV